jgi:serine phosphatase RsbU (regulator of sigma subunit)
LFLLNLCFGIKAQVKYSNGGDPLVSNFKTSDYKLHPQNWCTVQDSSGIVFVGNHVGLLVNSGGFWRKFVTPNGTDIRYLCFDKQGKLYYGARDDFGEIEYSNGTDVKFVSYSALINKSGITEFGDVWKVYDIPDIGVVFQSFYAIFIYNNKQLEILKPQNTFHLSYELFGKFYVIDRNHGLFTIDKNKLVKLKSNDDFRLDRIYCMIPFGDRKALINTRERGFFTAYFEAPDSMQVESFSTELLLNYPDAITYCGLSVSNKHAAIGTLNHGLFIIDSKGKIVDHFDTKSGLQNQSIKLVYKDKTGAFWLALESGISTFNYNYPYKHFGDRYNVQNTVNSIAEFDQKLFTATAQGVYFKSIGDFKMSKLRGLDDQVFKIQRIKFDNNSDSSLIIAGTQGLFSYINTNLKLINNSYFWSFNQYALNSDYLIGGTVDGIKMFKFNQGNWNNVFELSEENLNGYRIESDDRGNIWIGTYSSGVFLLKPKFDLKNNDLINQDSFTIIYFDESNGLPKLTGNKPVLYKGEVVITTINGGILHFDEKINKLIPHKDFEHLSSLNSEHVHILQEDGDKIWKFGYSEELSNFGYLKKNAEGRYVFYDKPFRLINDRVFHSIYKVSDEEMWIGAADGLYSYNHNADFNPYQGFNTLLRNISFKNDTIAWYIVRNTVNQDAVAYANNTAGFSFSAASYLGVEENKFSYKLEGFDAGWSPWTKETHISYTNLPEGKYTFHVKSQNVFGVEGSQVSYSFIISPPWYRTIYAYGGYLLLGILLVYGTVQISVARLKQAKVRLEAVVKERTAEVVKQKEEVEAQKQVIELKNRDITDSINYAKRIQEAILPELDEVYRHLPDSFVLFRPRDIVSGDFYWFSSHHVNKDFVFIAAVDCTGHGVPGAFMSMIGNTLLNEIVDEKQIIEPALILNALHEAVRAVLKQGYQGAETNDGMDIALCRLNIRTGELDYAGANRPLWILRKKDGGTFEMEITKPDKFPIGGSQIEEQRLFTNQSLKLNKGDQFFIFSDGYADQFGGPVGKKLMVKRLNEELFRIAALPAQSQKNHLEKMHSDWMGEHEQVDDVLVIGVRF